MSVAILGQGKYLALRFIVPATRVVTIDFESSNPVDLYVLSEAQLQLFKTNINNSAFLKYPGRNQYFDKFQFSLPAGSIWYLVPVNFSGSDVAIYYRVHNSQ